MQKIDRTGEENISYQGYQIIIQQYNNYNNILVEFQDEHKAIVHTSYKCFKSGNVKNPYHPIVYGVGYVGNTKARSDKDTMKKSYNTWHDMLRRCYDDKNRLKSPTYINCSVSSEWFCFENFEKWYDENYYEINGEKMALDKDILCKDNKIYSPETCVFVPININSLFTKTDKNRGLYPIGVNYYKSNKKYEASCCDGTKHNIHLGFFNNSTDAFYAYKNGKETIIKQIANEYKNQIPEKLYNAMMNYEVEITD